MELTVVFIPEHKALPHELSYELHKHDGLVSLDLMPCGDQVPTHDMLRARTVLPASEALYTLVFDDDGFGAVVTADGEPILLEDVLDEHLYTCPAGRYYSVPGGVAPSSTCLSSVTDRYQDYQNKGAYMMFPEEGKSLRVYKLRFARADSHLA